MNIKIENTKSYVTVFQNKKTDRAVFVNWEILSPEDIEEIKDEK